MNKTKIDRSQLNYLKSSLFFRYEREQDFRITESMKYENKERFQHAFSSILDSLELDLESSRMQYPVRTIEGINPFIFEPAENSPFPQTEFELTRICKSYQTYLPPRWVKRVKRNIRAVKTGIGISPTKEELTRIARESLVEQIEHTFMKGYRFWLVGTLRQEKGDSMEVIPRVFFPGIEMEDQTTFPGLIKWFEDSNAYFSRPIFSRFHFLGDD